MQIRPVITIGLVSLALFIGAALGRWTVPLTVKAAEPAINISVSRSITATDYEVVRVIDGDTFKVRYDGDLTSVRLLDINAPERGTPDADAATAELRRLIEGKVVHLDFAAARRRDNFGRLLCRVTVDGLDVNQHLLDQGFATPYRPGPRRENAEP
ncbi:MAG: thermonuclease family protein [Planctomycetota bacterium]